MENNSSRKERTLKKKKDKKKEKFEYFLKVEIPPPLFLSTFSLGNE
jgi:hypothetical protein